MVDEHILQIIGKPKNSQVAGFGTVKFYTNNPTKLFGFLSSEAGDVFFHASRCYRLADNGTDLPGLGLPETTVEGSLLDAPKRDDQVLFIAEQGPKGLRAVRWVKWSDDILQTVLDEITARPKYQFIQREGAPIPDGGLELGSLKILWEGQDLGELRKKFSKTRHPVFNDDTGARYFELLDNSSGEWNACSDPR